MGIKSVVMTDVLFFVEHMLLLSINVIVFVNGLLVFFSVTKSPNGTSFILIGSSKISTPLTLLAIIIIIEGYYMYNYNNPSITLAYEFLSILDQIVLTIYLMCYINLLYSNKGENHGKSEN